MSAYDDSTRLAILAIQDANLLASESIGLMFSESVVQIAVATMAGADKLAGIPGTQTVAYTVIAPRPLVDLRDQFRTRAGITQHVGDALLMITRAITRAQLLAASWIEIDGEKFTIVAGELRREAFDWSMVVKRMQA
jgi:hypothetical protein